jgi:hypothetical protein
VSPRALVIGGVALALILLVNIVVLTIYLPRLVRPPAAPQTAAAAPASPLNPGPSSTNPPPAKHVAKPEGDVVQRSEVSPSGNIRVKYARRKGGPVRQIIIEPAAGLGDSKVLFEHQRNAWVVISPNDEWIALNNRPKPGESHLTLYRRTRPNTVDFAPAEDIAVEGLPLEDAVWNHYVEAMGLPPNTPREAATIDAVRWENDSTLTISVAVTPLADDDKVPPPWTCTFNVGSDQLEATEETAQAVALQEGQTTDASGPNFTGSTAVPDNLLRGNFPGERFPATRLRVLEEDEVSTWPGENIRYALNELYARRGYDFSDNAEQRRLFAKMSWYRPRPGSMEEIDKDFSSVEKENVDLLAKFRSVKQSQRRQAKSSRAQRSATPGPGEKFWQAFKDGWRPPTP